MTSFPAPLYKKASNIRQHPTTMATLQSLPNELVSHIVSYTTPETLCNLVCTSRKFAIPGYFWNDYIKRNHGLNSYFHIWKDFYKAEGFNKRTFRRLQFQNELFRTLRLVAMDLVVSKDIHNRNALILFSRIAVNRKQFGDSRAHLVDHIVDYGDLAFYLFKDDRGNYLRDGLRQITPAYMVYILFFKPLTKNVHEDIWPVGLSLYSWFLGYGQ